MTNKDFYRKKKSFFINDVAKGLMNVNNFLFFGRSVYLVYDKKDSVQNIDLYRFTTDGYSMLNASKNPDNNAFCVGGCGPDGIIPIGQCQDGGYYHLKLKKNLFERCGNCQMAK